MAYLDTSALVPLLVPETGTERVMAWLSGTRDRAPTISAWTRTEMVSAISGKVRSSVIAAPAARKALTWARQALLPRLRLEPVEPIDLLQAATLLERFELGLRAGDALHLAITRRLGEPLLTLDRRLAASAAALGVAVVALG